MLLIYLYLIDLRLLGMTEPGGNGVAPALQFNTHSPEQLVCQCVIMFNPFAVDLVLLFTLPFWNLDFQKDSNDVYNTISIEVEEIKVVLWF